MDNPQVEAALRLTPSTQFIRRAEAAAAVARSHADDVDRSARFPKEAFDELRRQRLLGMLVPVELGGDGASVSDTANVCAILAEACSSTGMIFAMHQVKAACIVRHHGDNPWQLQFLSDCAEKQYLLASSTTEGSAGGDVRSSQAPIEADGSGVRLTRDASCISYGAEADGIVTTARRDQGASNSDQVLAVFRREDYSLKQTQSWDTLGMRGTRSVGFLMQAEGHADQVLRERYDRIHTLTMVPYAHLLWGATWQGVAAGAVGRAREFVRQAARNSGGRMPPGAAHLTAARVKLETLRSVIRAALTSYEQSCAEPSELESASAQLALNFLKVEASELATETVMSAMRVCGLSGYRNDTPFSMGRYLRDILSSPIMINNDRILANSETSVLMSMPPVWMTA